MRLSILFLTIVLLVAAGCGGPSHYWFQRGMTFEQARADYCDCEREARQEASAAVAQKYRDRVNSPLQPPAAYSSPRDDAVFAEDPFDAWVTWGQTYQQNVFTGCMKRRGYELLKSGRLPARLRTRDLSLGAIAGR